MDAERVRLELAKNEKLRAEGMRQGMEDLLSLHNCVELGHLCEALSIVSLSNTNLNSPTATEDLDKESLIQLIFDKAIEPSTNGYQPVLDAMWDGILIEYLRKSGKNLARCRNKLRGAVVQHWTRNVITVATSAEGSTPAYSRAWGRTEPSCEVDIAVLSRIERIQAAEKAMKDAERQVRRCADFPSITAFISNINALREREEDTRGVLLKHLEDLLNHRDDCRRRAGDAEAEAKRLREEWKDMKEQLCANKAMLKYRARLEWDRVIDRVHAGVREASLNIQLKKERELGGLEARRHTRIEAYLQQRKADLEVRLAELEMNHDEVRSQLRATVENLTKERAAHCRTKEAFKTFRERSLSFTEKTLSNHSRSEFKEAFALELLVQQTAQHMAEKERLHEQQRAGERTREQLERFLMASNDTLVLSDALRPRSRSERSTPKTEKKRAVASKRGKVKRGNAPGKVRASQTAKELSLATSSVQSLATESATSTKAKTKRTRKKVRKAKSSRRKGSPKAN